MADPCQIVCTSIFEQVGLINQQVESMDELKEDARRLYRYVRRTEVVVSDLQPYIQQAGPNQSAQQPLHAIEAVLLQIRQDMEDCCAKGKLTAFMQADIMLSRFNQAAASLDEALGRLPADELNAPEETAGELAALRSMLQRARFELPEAQAAMVARFRDACDQLRTPFEQLQGSAQDILLQVGGQSTLTREEYQAVVADLHREARLLAKYGGEAQEREEFHIRMLMDLVRILHASEATPVEFICPLTTCVMTDPVLLHETGHSYEREALEEWWAKGKRMCPRSGLKLKSKVLGLSPNTALKAAIQRWYEDNNMQLTFRPVIDTLAGGGARDMLAPAFGSPLDAEGNPLPAACAAGRLETILGEAAPASEAGAPTTPEADVVSDGAAFDAAAPAAAAGAAAAAQVDADEEEVVEEEEVEAAGSLVADEEAAAEEAAAEEAAAEEALELVGAADAEEAEECLPQPAAA